LPQALSVELGIAQEDDEAICGHNPKHGDCGQSMARHRKKRRRDKKQNEKFQSEFGHYFVASHVPAGVHMRVQNLPKSHTI
jgi:hypothetical protein